MIRRAHRLVPLGSVLAAGLLLAATPAAAGPATERLRDLFASVNATLAAPETREKPERALGRIRALIDDACDVGDAAARALGPAWRARTPAEREEFVRLFDEILQRAYLGRLAGVARVRDGIRVSFLQESASGDGAVVHTTVVSRDGHETPVEYRMVQRGERWLVRDLVMDGVSVVDNYRAQFRRLLRQGTYASLVTYLKTRFGLAPAVRAASATTAPAAPPVLAPVPPPPPVPAARPAPAAAAASGEASPSPAPAGRAPADGAATARARRPAERPDAWWVQVGAFRSAAAAAALVERVRGEIAVTPPAAGREPLLRVRVGPFADRATAVARARALQRRGFRTLVAR